MGKATLFIIAGFVILGAYYSIGAQRGVAETDQRLAEHQFEVLSRNAALTGYSVAKQRLSEDFLNAPTTISGTYNGSSYGVQIVKNGAIAKVTSTGTSHDGTGKAVTYKVVAEIEREVIVEIAEEAPPFMQYALISDEDLNLDGDVLAELYIQGDEANTLNANLHTNKNMFIKGNSVRGKGFGTFANSGNANPSTALEGSFKPNYNPTDAPSAAKSNKVDIPPFDAALFASKVNVKQTSPGDVTLSGTYELGGTREDPYVWHIQGNVTAEGGTSINGYALFLIEGDMTFKGNFTSGPTGYEGSDESSLAFYTGGDVSLGGNATVFGQVYVGGVVTFQRGTPRVNGNIVSLKGAVIGGNPSIYYRTPSPALAIVFQDPDVRLKQISYTEW